MNLKMFFLAVLACPALSGSAQGSAWYTQTRESREQDLFISIPKTGTPSLSTQVSLDGRSYFCRLDTASSTMIVPRADAFAQDKRLKPDHSIGIACDIIKEERISLRDLSFLGGEQHEVEAALREPSKNEPSWCAIGNTVLAGKQWVFDFGRQKLVEGPQKIVRELHPLILNEHGMPEIDIAVDGVPARALWDSAADSSFIDRDFAVKQKLVYESKGKSQVWDSTGNTKVFELVVVKSLSIGGQEFKDQTVLLGDLKCLKMKRGNDKHEGDFDLVLGLTTVLNADWYFDFGGLRWALDVKDPERLAAWGAKRNSMKLPAFGKARFVDQAGLFDGQKAKELGAVLDKFCSDWWAGARVVVVPSIGNWDLADFTQKAGQSSLSAFSGSRALVAVFDVSNGNFQVWVPDRPKGDLAAYFDEARIRKFIQPAQADFDGRRYPEAVEKVILKLFRDWKEQ
jgi:hypothetical protein